MEIGAAGKGAPADGWSEGGLGGGVPPRIAHRSFPFFVGAMGGCLGFPLVPHLPFSCGVAEKTPPPVNASSFEFLRCAPSSSFNHRKTPGSPARCAPPPPLRASAPEASTLHPGRDSHLPPWLSCQTTCMEMNPHGLDMVRKFMADRLRKSFELRW